MKNVLLISSLLVSIILGIFVTILFGRVTTQQKQIAALQTTVNHMKQENVFLDKYIQQLFFDIMQMEKQTPGQKF